MKKISGVIVALLLVIVTLFGFAGCGSGSQSELQSKIDELQSQIQELEDKLSEMDEHNKELNAKIEEMDGQLREQDERIEELEKQAFDELFTLQQAYDNGWLSKDDLMSIAYYYHGGRAHNEEIMSEVYKPILKAPETLSDATQTDIKSIAAKNYRENGISEAITEGFRIIGYYGVYGDCVAVRLEDDYTGIPGVVVEKTVAGVNFYYPVAIEIMIWKDIK